MKDSYSFDVSDAALDVSFQLHHKAYCNIFSRCGLNFHYTVFSLVNDARIGLVVLPQEETKASEVNDLVTSQRVIGK
jgi:hypothetical protein